MSTNKRGTRYDEEFKRTLVNLYQNGNKSQAAICKEYGVSITALGRWIKQYSTVEVDDGEVLTAKQVKELGYHVRMFYVGLDTLDESLSRIQNRVKRGGHDIPHDDVSRRFSSRWEALAKVLPYCDEAEFYDNDNGFVKVAEYRNGEFRTVGNRIPNWILELQNYLRS